MLRVAPGQAEIHTKDTDIVYVLDGEATGGFQHHSTLVLNSREDSLRSCFDPVIAAIVAAVRRAVVEISRPSPRVASFAHGGTEV